MTTPVQVVTGSTTPELVQLLEVRKAVDGIRGPGESPYPYAPGRVAAPDTPAVKRVTRLGSMVDRYL